MGGWVYIITNKRNGTLYIGVTAKLSERIAQHQQGKVKGFTQRYGLKTLVYAEKHDRIEDAIAREKAMKHRLRKWKIELIEKSNPDWHDIGNDIHF